MLYMGQILTYKDGLRAETFKEKIFCTRVGVSQNRHSVTVTTLRMAYVCHYLQSTKRVTPTMDRFIASRKPSGFMNHASTPVNQKTIIH